MKLASLSPLKADEANGEAWTLRAAAFAEMGEDGSILEIVALHLRKAAQLSPDDDELQAQHAVAACRAAVLGTVTDPPRVEGTLAERAREAATLLEDGAALMREGLYRTAHGRYMRAVDLLDGLPGPRAKAAADARPARPATAIGRPARLCMRYRRRGPCCGGRRRARGGDTAAAPPTYGRRAGRGWTGARRRADRALALSMDTRGVVVQCYRHGLIKTGFTG